jgi:sugar lactone lactonase YvrE
MFSTLRNRFALLSLAAALLLLALASTADADTSICPPGSGAGQCNDPQGIAVDNETGHLYVADRDNNRIDVFEADGTFVLAFGWGVDTEAGELQTCTTASKCNAGIAGSAAGQFDHPTWIAVDNDASSASRHDVYVGTDNFAVQKFKPTGEFVKAFGGKGTGSCQFNRERDPIAVGPGGDVYVADSYDKDGEGPFDEFLSRVERFDSAGNCLGTVDLFEGARQFIRNFAVDSAGNSYVAIEGGGGGLRKYDPSGALLYEVDHDFQTEGLAIGEADHVFAEQTTLNAAKTEFVHLFTEYSPSGAPLSRFGYLVEEFFDVPALAAFHSAGGDLFASEGARGIKYLTLPPPGPVVMSAPCKTGSLGNAKATLTAEVNPEGKATTVHFQYVDQKSFEDESGFASAKTKETEESASIGEDFVLHKATGEADLVPDTTYRCRVLATNADAPGGIFGEEGSFTSLPPLQIGTTTVSNVGAEEATLNATVNPLGIAATGYFEYVTETAYLKDVAELGPEHGFDHATKAPDTKAGEEAIDFGGAESFNARSVTLSGLTSGTSYRYRIVATDLKIFPREIAGPTMAFRTFGLGTGALPDNRAWELVSPGEKNSAEVAMPSAPAGLKEDRTTRIQTGSGSGEAVTYTSLSSFADPESAPGTSQYLSKRTASGWATENISPRGIVRQILSPPYNGFSPDLGFAALRVSEPSLAPGCPEGYENLYLRDNATGTLRCLTPEAPNAPIGVTPCFTYAGASEDASHVFFAAPIPYAGAPQGDGFSLYEWFEGKLRVVSILPGQSTPVAPTHKTSFGEGDGNCQWALSILRHVVSADGSRVFWTYVPEPIGSEPSKLLVRVGGTETIQLDAPQGGSDKVGGNGQLWAASKDGSVAYFTDTARLVSGSKAEAGKPGLYRYELGNAKPLSDLTKGVQANVQGVIGASDDGSYVYFVAKGVLSGEEENAEGQKASEGANNLYLYHEGKTSFIAALSSDPGSVDITDWESQQANRTARVSADGRHLAFLSLEAKALVGYDNTIASGEHCRYFRVAEELVGSPLCAQAFLYDADSKELTCASCNPSGARPLRETLLPGWANAYEGPRYLSADGSRFFFETLDALTLADENGKRDVYEFERAGTGGCDSKSPAFDPVSGGCHFLLSGGKSTDESYFVDASENGRDAFFSTRSSLVGWDVNENYDVYDAREGGGFAEPSEEAICGGEACLPPVPVPPNRTSPPRFEGPGNPTHKGHKHRKHGKHKAKKKHKKANRKRGARR